MPSRRAVLTTALAMGAVTACTPESSPAPPQPTRDELIAAEARSAQLALVALLDSVALGRPRRLHALAPTRAVHLAHLELLAEAVAGASRTPDPRPGAPFSGGDRAAYRAVARAEDELGSALRRAAVEAGSGPFARVLAAMAAASAQQAAWVRRLA